MALLTGLMLKVKTACMPSVATELETIFQTIGVVTMYIWRLPLPVPPALNTGRMESPVDDPRLHPGRAANHPVSVAEQCTGESGPGLGAQSAAAAFLIPSKLVLDIVIDCDIM